MYAADISHSWLVGLNTPSRIMLAVLLAVLRLNVRYLGSRKVPGNGGKRHFDVKHLANVNLRFAKTSCYQARQVCDALRDDRTGANKLSPS